MSFQVRFDSLDMMYSGICSRVNEWGTSLGEVNDKVNILVNTSYMTGSGAESAQLYLDCIHNTVFPLLGELLLLHANNCLLYVRDYQSNVDQGLHAVILEDELLKLKSVLKRDAINSISVDDRVQSALRSVSDLISVSCRGINAVCDDHEDIRNRMQTLMDNIERLEEAHSQSDFSATGELISKLKVFLQERLSDSRDFKTNFSVQSLAGSSTFLDMYQAYLAVNEKNANQQEAVAIANEEENKRIEALQEEYQKQLEEYEKRQKEADAAKWIVTGVCVVASFIVIAGTGGAATPLVIGTVSAVSGAVSSGFNSAADQYVEHGWSMEQWNWNSVGNNALLGGVSGFITGYVGAGFGEYLTKGFSTLKIGSTLLNSSSAAVRVGTGAIIGSIAETVSGIGSRGTASFVTTMISTEGDWSESLGAAKDSAFNLKAIAFDAAVGGVSGGIKAYRQPVGRKITREQIDEFKDSKPYHSPDAEKWLLKGGEIYVDANGTWTFVSADGITVCYSDGYADFKRAGCVESKYKVEGGFDTTNHNVDIKKAQNATGLGTKGSGMTWHHDVDGHTLQLIDRRIHELFRHTGGFSIAKKG